jgi:hypothetical protein
MPYDFTLKTVIPASAGEIYDAWLDSVAHFKMTGGKAQMSDKIGAEVSAWDGYITGRNLELMPHQWIVQSWRTTDFTDDHADSVITVMLEDDDEGTLLTLIHSNVPDSLTSYEQGGWQDNYFEPMTEYFSKRADPGKSAKAAPIRKRQRVNLTLRKTGRENDYVILMDGTSVGRIVRQTIANNSEVWLWLLTRFGPQDGPMYGRVFTLDDAKRASRAAIERLSRFSASRDQTPPAPSWLRQRQRAWRLTTF